jgi:DNA-binding MarR family transcriptional regulator
MLENPIATRKVKRLDRRRRDIEDASVAETDLVRLLLEGHRVVSAELVSSMEERGYPDAKAAHGAVFMNIDRRSGTGLTELARRAGITKQGMMLIVDDLEQRGYVRRVPDAEDARAKVVRLTARGRRYVAEARRAMAALEARARRELGERRYEALRDGLELLASGSEVTEE